ncbi:MAG: hypothetical protein MRY57_03465 [Candidatus Pacebacteria bacterium]|nr:hypothetical protein [Candidatus Paceibacterota bacterium]
MKWLSFKKITFVFLVLTLLSNVFATNVQTFDTSAEQCELENLYTNPCAIAYIGDVAVEIEQDTDITSIHIDIAAIDFEFISLIQENITPQKTDFSQYYATDLSPPTFIQLPRSHIVIS